MKRISQGTGLVISSMLKHLSLEEFAELVYFIKTDPIEYITKVEERATLKPDHSLVQRVEDENDYCNLNLHEFLIYCFTKNEDPTKKLIEVYQTITGDIISGDCLSDDLQPVC